LLSKYQAIVYSFSNRRKADMYSSLFIQFFCASLIGLYTHHTLRLFAIQYLLSYVMLYNIHELILLQEANLMGTGGFSNLQISMWN
jgi:hypothetical protein